MAGRRRHEPTKSKNPRQLTLYQHVHSKACIDRFADTEGRVAVVRPGDQRSFLVKPDNAIFCAKRVWDERLEHGGLVRRVERAFQNEIDTVVDRGTVSDYRAITEYVSIWQIRGRLADKPPDDVVLHRLSHSSERLPKDQEETIEAKHGAFERGDSIPGRFVASMEATRDHDINMSQLGGIRWGVLRAKGEHHFVCPGSPAGELYVPVDPTLALIAGRGDSDLSSENVDHLNRSLKPGSLIFGHPADVEAFLGRARAFRR
jgi:hypothetical protein